MSESWSNIELELIVNDYFNMLVKEMTSLLYNKTEHRKNLMKTVNRTDGSIEFKHQNISAVMIKLGLPYIKGYKPAWNYQKALEEKVIQILSIQKSNIELSLVEFSDSAKVNIQPDFSKIIEDAPERKILNEPEIEYKRRPIKINYLEREQNSIKLGEKGELLVFEYEKWRLSFSGKEALADKVEWIAQNDDGAGFDILSKNNNGTDRYIEVKSTKLGKEAPIFFSQNEYLFSRKNAESYFLYRVFNLSANPKIFQMNGDFDSFCQKEILSYKGLF